MVILWHNYEACAHDMVQTYKIKESPANIVKDGIKEGFSFPI